jgi:DNA-binding NarL/FixJ family response regulator
VEAIRAVLLGRNGLSARNAIVNPMPRALVVTDADWVRNDVLASITLGDWEINSIDDPESVLDHVLDDDPDVVIIDMQVASMGGMAVIRAITSTLPPDVRPRTILLLDRSADTFLAKRAGADACVLKPFTAQDMRGALDSLSLPVEVAGSGPRKSRPKR